VTRRSKVQSWCATSQTASLAALTQQLESHGFGGSYDLVYVPIDRSSGNLNLGYSFINFRQEDACSRFRHAFHGKGAKVLFPNSSSDKVLIVALASVQGRDAYLTRLSSFVWAPGSDVWQPLIFDDHGRRIKLTVGEWNISPSADIKDTEAAAAAAAAACASSHTSGVLRAEAPEFVPTGGFPTTGEINYEVESLDHLFNPLCGAQFHGPPGLTSPVLECCSVQPELHMAALAKATQYAQSRSVQAGASGSMGLTLLDPPDAAQATVASEVGAVKCEPRSEETIPMAEEQSANTETPEFASLEGSGSTTTGTKRAQGG